MGERSRPAGQRRRARCSFGAGRSIPLPVGAALVIQVSGHSGQRRCSKRRQWFATSRGGAHRWHQDTHIRASTAGVFDRRVADGHGHHVGHFGKRPHACQRLAARIRRRKRTRPTSSSAFRVAVEALIERSTQAGAGAHHGLAAGALGFSVASVFPFRQGAVAPDPPGTFRTDTLTVLYVLAQTAAQTTIRQPMAARSGTAFINLDAGCPANDPTCGFAAGMDVMVTTTPDRTTPSESSRRSQAPWNCSTTCSTRRGPTRPARGLSKRRAIPMPSKRTLQRTPSNWCITTGSPPTPPLSITWSV